MKRVWLLAVVVFAVLWLGNIHTFFWLDIALPLIVWSLSLFAFASAPRPIRVLHHSVVSIALLAYAGFLISAFFFTKDAPLGLYLVLQLAGILYLGLLIILMLALAANRLTLRARSSGRGVAPGTPNRPTLVLSAAALLGSGVVSLMLGRSGIVEIVVSLALGAVALRSRDGDHLTGLRQRVPPWIYALLALASLGPASALPRPLFYLSMTETSPMFYLLALLELVRGLAGCVSAILFAHLAQLGFRPVEGDTGEMKARVT